jgi:hypothetical protein
MAQKSIITHIEAQTERIISQYELLEAGYASACEERDALRIKVREQEEQLRQMKAEVQRLRLAEGLAGGKTTDNEKARARINLLLREVDKCIALLTKAQQN